MKVFSARQRWRIVKAFLHGESTRTLSVAWETSIEQIEKILRDAFAEWGVKEPMNDLIHNQPRRP